ncbi:uncharacterized protein LOC119072086 [Bradysia coprophila]|uniref:uncharacterized protein LOC119072086 n=1 Tax=Bradysia coprophila TaxID=38358 RepID=UPI00187DC877|nr:uncharacterized protein LOC119072086 [Bradysia coprophila]XP_037033140.1 uncharacterized protein LOC119072086 [Bradysia coprophila]
MFHNITAGITVLTVITSAVAQQTYTHAEALEKIEAVGITIASSGNCSDRNIASCTSLEQIRRKTIDSGVIVLKEASQCDIIITGGTEVGHSSSTYSHFNGYKLDYRLNTCLNDYIMKRYTYLGLRGDGAKKYMSAAGNIYALEGNHWDVTYY